MAYVAVAVRLARHYAHPAMEGKNTATSVRAGAQYIPPEAASRVELTASGRARERVARETWPDWLKTLLSAHAYGPKYAWHLRGKMIRVLVACEVVPGLLDWHAWKRTIAPEVGETLKDENR